MPPIPLTTLSASVRNRQQTVMELMWLLLPQALLRMVAPRLAEAPQNWAARGKEKAAVSWDLHLRVLRRLDRVEFVEVMIVYFCLFSTMPGFFFYFVILNL